MNKHAYLIIAHNNLEQLQMLVTALDAPFQDIYIHFDRASKDSIGINNLKTRYAELKVYSEFEVHWGGYSIVKTELFLFEQAFQKKYSYYHLLSGSDFPIKPPKIIFDFFEASQKEFVLFSNKEMLQTDFDRIDYRHICTEKFRTGKNKYENKVIDLLDNLGVLAQKFMQTKQARIFPNYQKGSQWVSLTGNFVGYILAQKDMIEKAFQTAFVPDEMFVQTVLINSPYRDCLYNNHDYNQPIQNMRYIDWTRGHPYTFSSLDLEELLASKCMFARKFDMKKDSKILHELSKCILE